ncbi:MAG: hypothetical protein PHI76_00415 [Clostridia bacterium]|nr:hypothetical protein [Clostridia bacterium]
MERNIINDKARELCEKLSDDLGDKVQTTLWNSSNLIFGRYEDLIFYIKFETSGHIIASTLTKNERLLLDLIPSLNSFMKSNPLMIYNRSYVKQNKRTATTVLEYETLTPEPKARLIEIINGMYPKKLQNKIENLVLFNGRDLSDYLVSYRKPKDRESSAFSMTK